jgi:carbonic anhydrase
VTRLRLVALASLALFAGCGDDDDADTSSEPERKPVAFSYTENGGPEEWASLSPDYATCETGREQSPVDLAEATSGALPPLEVNYVAGPAEIENNGHTVEVIFEEGASSVVVDGKEYFLIQAHYHLPSEHRLGRVQEPLELHFVHGSADEELLVLGVFASVGDPSGSWEKVAGALPAEEGEPVPLGEVDPADLLPANAATGPRWSYDGSLTTPPCSEGVKWNVIRPRITMSPEQLRGFRAGYEGNNRPPQPLNERELVLGRPN